MPTYGYRCDNCGNRFDVKQSFNSEPRYECPECQHIARRQFHAPPVIYKGSGFYTTDYARKGASNGGANNSTGSGSSSSSSSDSSDSSSSTSDSTKSTSTTSDSSSSSTSKSESSSTSSTSTPSSSSSD